MTTTTVNHFDDEPETESAKAGRCRRRSRLGQLFGAWRRWRLHQRMRPRRLRRQLRRLGLSEGQLDSALRAQQQMRELGYLTAKLNREVDWNLLTIVMDPDQQRAEAKRSTTRLTRAVDEKTAELVMTLADFGDQLDGEQRLALKCWLAFSR